MRRGRGHAISAYVYTKIALYLFAFGGEHSCGVGNVLGDEYVLHFSFNDPFLTLVLYSVSDRSNSFEANDLRLNETWHNV